MGDGGLEIMDWGTGLNRLEIARISWNRLELAIISWNRLE